MGVGGGFVVAFEPILARGDRGTARVTPLADEASARRTCGLPVGFVPPACLRRFVEARVEART